MIPKSIESKSALPLWSHANILYNYTLGSQGGDGEAAAEGWLCVTRLLFNDSCGTVVCLMTEQLSHNGRVR